MNTQATKTLKAKRLESEKVTTRNTQTKKKRNINEPPIRRTPKLTFISPAAHAWLTFYREEKLITGEYYCEEITTIYVNYLKFIYTKKSELQNLFPTFKDFENSVSTLSSNKKSNLDFSFLIEKRNFGAWLENLLHAQKLTYVKRVRFRKHTIVGVGLNDYNFPNFLASEGNKAPEVLEIEDGKNL